MVTEQVEVFSSTSNHAVVRMPGRQFPGCVVQGDSLYVLCQLARSVQQRVAGLGDEEFTEEAAELGSHLERRLEHYEQVLASHGLALPYQKS